MIFLKTTDIICIILILSIAFIQTRVVIDNIKKARKYHDNLNAAYIFGVVIPLSFMSNHRIKAYITLLYGLILIILVSCVYLFYLRYRKDEDTKYIKKDLKILFFVVIIIFVIEYLTNFN